jgi:DNA-directed RNA polymerase specialized sigma24 family protein
MAGSITGWLQSVRDGSDDAAKNIWDRWFERLCNRVSRHSGRLRIHDNEDIASDAFVDFFTALRDGKFSSLRNRSQIWKLLATIAVRKSRDTWRFECAKRRGGGLQIHSLNDADGESSSMMSQRRPVTNDLIEELIGSIDDPRLVKVIRLKIDGMDNVDLAHEMGCSVRSIQYMVKELENRILGGTTLPTQAKAS